MSYTIDTRKLAEIQKEIKDAILQKLQDARADLLEACQYLQVEEIKEKKKSSKTG